MNYFPVIGTASFAEAGMTHVPKSEGVVYAAVFDKSLYYATSLDGSDLFSQICEINRTTETGFPIERIFSKGVGGASSVLFRFWESAVTHVTYVQLFRGTAADALLVEKCAQHAFQIAAGALPLANLLSAGGSFPRVEIMQLQTLFSKHASVIQGLQAYSCDAVRRRLDAIAGIVGDWAGGGGRTHANIRNRKSGVTTSMPLKWTMYQRRNRSGRDVYRGLRVDKPNRSRVISRRIASEDRFFITHNNNGVIPGSTGIANITLEGDCIKRLIALRCRV